MEKLKDPAMFLSLINTVGGVGIAYYFYKQLETIRTENGQTTTAVSKLIKTMDELAKNDKNKGDIIRILTEDVKQLKSTLEVLPSCENYDGLNMDIDEIVNTLSEQCDINIDRPSIQFRRSGDRPYVNHNDDRSVKRIQPRLYDRADSFRDKPTSESRDQRNSRNTNSYRDNRDHREQRDQRDQREQRSQNNGQQGVKQPRRIQPDKINEDNDDEDLINAVRNQSQ